jgi:protein FAM50
LVTLTADFSLSCVSPQHVTFYDLIVTKARGKSGPLFHFDVHDDVRFVCVIVFRTNPYVICFPLTYAILRLTNDARIEKDESHPGKVVERRWYEKNKHIFPASRWEIYDPNIMRDKYTIHGNEVKL